MRKDSLRRRLRELEARAHTKDGEPEYEWMKAVPRELWNDRLAAWRHYVGQKPPDPEPE